jgi:hypothetical protein
LEPELGQARGLGGSEGLRGFGACRNSEDGRVRDLGTSESEGSVRGFGQRAHALAPTLDEYGDRESMSRSFALEIIELELLVSGGWRLEAGDPRLEAADWRLETGGQC